MMENKALLYLMVIIVLGMILAGCTPPTPEPETTTDANGTDQQTSSLGEVHFEVSCNEEAQREFDRAVALLHSFWFPKAISSFEATLEKDSSCGMAHWGIALGRWGNFLGGPRDQAQLQTGWEATQKAAEIGAGTERERDYIAAVELLYMDYKNTDNKTRKLAYEKAMEAIVEKHPEDSEAKAFYGIALNGTADLADKTYANQLKATALMEPLFKEQPNHPGLAHYIIHSYDFPPLADRGRDAAYSYAEIAPDAPHAQHMPSHIFTRIGAWQDSIDTNIRSAASAKTANSPVEILHAFDYKVYAYLQSAQDEKAQDVVQRAMALKDSISSGDGYLFAADFALAAIPARYALERQDWTLATRLEVRESRFPHAKAITLFARALGAARSGDVEAAGTDLEALRQQRKTLVEAGPGLAYWELQVRIQEKMAEAWIDYAAGNTEQALEKMKTAAELEDTTEKSAVSPGPLVPARELYGSMLLEDGQSETALAQFEASAKDEPNRFIGTYEAAKAAEMTGDMQKAKQSYAQLLEICERADDAGREAVQQARQFVNQS